MVNEFPIKPIRRILKKYYGGEISEEACIQVRNSLLEFTECLAQEGVKEFEELNQKRRNHNLPTLKRLPGFVFKDVSDRVFKRVADNDMGLVGDTNTILLSPEGDIISRRKKDITKDAVEVV